MKVRLLFEDRASDPIVLSRNPQTVREALMAPQPPLVQDVVNDLDLTTLWGAMAGDDPVLWLAARRTMLAEPLTPAQIGFRQGAVRDCLRHPDTVRALYRLACDGVEAERNIFRGSFANRGERLLSWSLQVLRALHGSLCELRRLADGPGRQFESEAFGRLFDEVREELDDAYLARVDRAVADLEFPDGLVFSAALGPGNRGIRHVLRRPTSRHRAGLLSWSLIARPTYGFTIPDRDEASFRALSELRDRGLTDVAAAVGTAAEQIVGYWTALRGELASYVGMLNLDDRLRDLGLPTCLPTAAPSPSALLGAEDLVDPGLALRTSSRVVGNDIEPAEVSLLVVTGANQGGKSTFLRSLGIAELLMAAGLPVPARSFTSAVPAGVFTHFRREEDPAMTGGKFDEELARMNQIVDQLRPGSLLLCNESFAATNEREGSDVAEGVVDSLRAAGVRVALVTHMYDLARYYEVERPADTLSLRSDPRPDGTRSHRLRPGAPRPTSYAADTYCSVFHEPLPAAETSDSELRDTTGAPARR